MATIVQPYNPWREQLALTALGNVAGNILGDLWQTHKQNEQNRKANAFRGALSEILRNVAQQGNITLAQPEAPQRYNSNPWAAAFHQKYAPLTQFDIATSQRMPTLQDIAQNADTLAASERFSKLSPEMVQNVKNDFINQAETKRLQDLQNSYIDSFRNANNPADMLRQLAMGVGQGALSEKALQPFAQWAIHQTPQYHQVDAGDRIIGSVFRPYEGSDTPTTQFNVGVSPNTAATVQGNIDAANIHANASRDVANINAQADYARGQATIEAQRLKGLQEQYNALKQEIDNDRENLRDMDENQAKIIQDTVIAPKEQKLKKLENKLWQGYAGMGTQTQSAADNPEWSVGEDFISGSNKGRFTGGYLDDRGDHEHQGDDLPAPEGTPITVKERAGENFIVSAVNSNPNASTYGNYVDVEGTRNGHKVKYRFAHLQTGSIRVTKNQKINAGDIIAGVGSTGRSSGSHLHIECWVDGKKVNPRTLYKDFPLQQSTKTSQTSAQAPQQPKSSSQPTTQPQTQTPQQTQDREVMRDKDGTIIYQSNLDEMIREGAKQGLGPMGVKARLRQKGFVDVPEKREVTSVPPVLNWSPSYMGGIPQGQALTSAPLPDVPPVIADSSATQPSVTPADYAQTEPQPQQPFMPPPLASMPTQSSPDNFNSWRSPFGSFDIHQPILGGGITNLPLPPQTVSDDTRNQPLFSGNAANMIRNAVAGLNLTQGKNEAIIPNINTQYRPYNFFPAEQLRYPDVFFGDWPIGAGYDAQQILGWINSLQGSFPDSYYDKNRRIAAPSDLHANPRQQYYSPFSFPFWNFIDWMGNGSVDGYDISPQVSISSPSQRVNYNNSARNALWNLILNRR